MSLARHLDLLRFVLRWDGSFWRRSPGKLTGSLVPARRPRGLSSAGALNGEFTAEAPRSAENAEKTGRRFVERMRRSSMSDRKHSA